MSRIIHDSILVELRKAREAYLKSALTDYESYLNTAREMILQLADLGLDEDEDSDVNSRLLQLYTLQGEYTFIASMRHLKEPQKLIPMYEEVCRKLVCLMSSRVVDSKEPYLPLEAYDDLPAFYDVLPEECEQFVKDLELAVYLYSEITGGGGAGTDRLFCAQAALKMGDLNKAHKIAGEVCAIAILSGFEWLEQPAVRLRKWIESKEK